MAYAEINAGVCGFITKVRATPEDEENVRVEIESPCSKVQQLGEILDKVSIFSGVLKNRGNPIFEAAISCELHAGCLVPIGIVKAIEVSASLALPKDASIKVL